MATVVKRIYVDDLTGEEVQGKAWKILMTVGDVTYHLVFSEDSKSWWDEHMAPAFKRADRERAANGLPEPHLFDVGTALTQHAGDGKPAQIDKTQRAAIWRWWAQNWETGELPQPPKHHRNLPQAVIEAYNTAGGLRIRPDNGTAQIREAVDVIKATAPVTVTGHSSTLQEPMYRDSGAGLTEQPRYSSSGSQDALPAGRQRRSPIPEDVFIAAYRQHGGNVAAVAKALGSTKSTVWGRVGRLRAAGVL